MRILFVLFTVLSLVGFMPEARAAESTAGAEAFATEVLARNPTLQSQVSARNAFRREAAAAGIWPDPEAAVMLDDWRRDADMPFVRYQLSQMIPWPGKLRLLETAAVALQHHLLEERA